jgi:hypothetical protein
MVAVLLAGLALQPHAGAAARHPTPATSWTLERGFAGLYNLDFAGAQQNFAGWQVAHPEDPMGPVSEAAGLLFSEFNRLGILESQFYENDSAFENRSKVTPDPAAKGRFQSALDRAQTLAKASIAKDPKDQNALFALTLSAGLQADYTALIEKRNFASLHYAKDASAWAQQLLALCPTCYDAHLATGFTKYIVGSMAAPVRWMMRLGGVPADKQGGIDDLKLTAEQGHYLKPLARILLAIAFVREKDKARALAMLDSLRTDFPGNGLFPREIARLESSR